MTPINIEALLNQIDDTQGRLFITWGRISANVAREDVAELEGLAHELGILKKIHLHAVADGRCPASLLTILAEIKQRAELRSSASEPESAVETPELDLHAPQSPRPARDAKPANSETPAPSIAAGDVF